MKVSSFLKVSSHIGRLASSVPEIHVASLSTGILGLDIASGIGGWPKNRIIEIFGPPSSGKTTITIHSIAECHKRGKYAAFIDLEHDFDLDYAINLGVDPDKLIISQPDSLNEGIVAIKEFCSVDEVELIVLDSIAMSATTQQLKGEVGDANIASKARLLSQEIPKIRPLLTTSGKTLLMLNGTRENPAAKGSYAIYQPGGSALKFAASMRVELRTTIEWKEVEESEEISVMAKFVKNKCSPPFKTTSFKILFGKGADNSLTLYEIALANNIITRKGNTHFFGEEKLGVGRGNVVDTIQSTEDLRMRLDKEVREYLKNNKLKTETKNIFLESEEDEDE